MKKETKRVVSRKKESVAELNIDESKIAGLAVERVAISKLKPHPKNPRTHPKLGSPEWNVLEASLKHDYFDPLVWNKRNGMLVSGHLRTKVFKHLGYTQADVVVVDYDENTHLARLIAANKDAGVNDDSRLLELFSNLTSGGFDLSLTGFTMPEIEGMSELPEDETPSTDAAEDDRDRYTSSEIALITKWFGKGARPTHNAETGQMWRVGDNYLYVGSVLSSYRAYLPFIDRLEQEFPERKVLLVPMPDPIMIGHVDERVACVFIQPSAIAASLALSVTKKIRPNHRIALV